ncbi:arginine deiminase [[Mycoplasma] testudinis]|uniref:arginine deiminase n=1 Tax=[Mycoplasma] testudinis TaxID=33924 RepID=UPI0006981B6F|nr:arginine deiminase family protein [[Mycoplasma] testudinis]
MAKKTTIKSKQKTVAKTSINFKKTKSSLSVVNAQPSKNEIISNNFGFNIGVNVKNEINKLSEVIVHRPGYETERLVGKLLTKNNFEGNMHLERAQREHDLFVNVLLKQGIKVYYLEKLVAEALEFAGPFVKDQFIKRFVSEAKVKSVSAYETCVNYFRSFNSTVDMINAMIAGVKQNEVPPIPWNRFSDVSLSSNPFLIKPLPKMLFQRDGFLSLGYGINLLKLGNQEKDRQTLFQEYLIKFHPRFDNLKLYFNRDFEDCKISGNDILLINEQNLLIGISDQTDVSGIETLARNVFNDLKNPIQRVVAVNINSFKQSKRPINLLQAFSMVDRDKFIIDQNLLNANEIFEITPSPEKDIDGIGKLKFKQLQLSFSQTIEAIINKRPKFIICGGGDDVRGERELADYGISVLTIAPGEVIAYDRNRYTNELLTELGVIVHTIPSAELSRAPGGPLNMLSTLWRD